MKALGLAGYFRSPSSKKPATTLQAALSLCLRQYFCLPLLKASHVRGQVEALEQELRRISTEVHQKTAKALNDFHNYVVSYWCRLMGSQTLSVAGLAHKTNNPNERFNGKMARELPNYPTLFRFIARWNEVVVTETSGTVSQSQAGTLTKRPLDLARKRLLEKAAQVEAQYMSGEIGAKDVLVQAAAHFDDAKVNKYLINSAEENVEEDEEDVDQPHAEEQDQAAGGAVLDHVLLDSDEEDEPRELPDIDPVEPVVMDPALAMDPDAIDAARIDDREAVLAANPGLEDVEDTWLSTVWPAARAGSNLFFIALDRSSSTTCYNLF